MSKHKTVYDKANIFCFCGMAWFGVVHWHGMAWHGVVWHGVAWSGVA